MTPEQLEPLFRKINEFDRHMGLDFSINGPGDVNYRLLVEKHHTSSPGVCHGAVLAGMMDAQLGLTALSHAVTEEKLCSTVELKTNFLQPALEGNLLVGGGEIDFKGKSIVVVSAWIKVQATGEMICKGMGTFNMYPMSKKELQGWNIKK